MHGAENQGGRREAATGWLLGALLVGAILLAYRPVWHAGFIWDDDAYVTGNQLLTAPDGWRRIWFSQDSPSQYFPLTYSSFRIEHGLWGLRPAGYHGVNVLLHVANALLLWGLLRRLGLPAAWLAAGLFALHPVQVETVAWVTERKNVLSLFFYLLSLRAWLEFVRKHHGIDDTNGPLSPSLSPSEGEREERRRIGVSYGLRTPQLCAWLFYGLALVFYLLALFSKTTACTLPVAMLLVLWLKGEPIKKNQLAQIAPFVGIGLGMGLLTVWWERHHIGTSGGVFVMGLLERTLIASRAVWFYAGKLFWPTNLTFSYPRWDINSASLMAYGWLAAVTFAGAGIMYARRYVGRGLEVALVFFVATLAPTLGFIMLFTFRYSFVADHYQYVACIGPLAVLAAGLSTVFSRWDKSGVWLQRLVCGALLTGLGLLTWRQVRVYHDPETLWRDTIAKNPESWLAYSNLGRILMHQGRFEEAMSFYRESLRINPKDVDALVSVGNALFGKQRYEEAASHYQQALAVNPRNPEAHVNLAVILANGGRLEEAMEHDRLALEANPNLLTAHVNLAVTLANLGRYEEAIEHYREALALNPNQPLTHINLAIALAAQGNRAEAATHYRVAAETVNQHADSLVQQGRLQEAEAQFAEAIRLIPDNAEAHYLLGALLAKESRKAEARKHFLEALRIKPGYPEAQRQLAALDSPNR